MANMTMRELEYEIHKCDNCIWAIWADSEPVGCMNCDGGKCPSMEKVFGMIEESEEHYTPSVTRGDFSPIRPWDAPGMSVSDFI